ncbi:hypothetical protein RIF29_34335 [Crotalaria pallida]|uniref:BED-type domain-containing protein n=1 Tax=Crotalaria pallida TaxID=3830 RepID=A0AAN9E942_CROPI
MTANIVEEKAVATPGRKEDSVSVDALEKYEAIPDSNVENFESQPNFDLSNPKRQPNEEGLDFDALINGDELGTLPDHESGNFEKPLNNHPENSEPLTNNHASNAEASKNSQPFNSDVLTTDESTNSEAPFDYEDFEALPINEADSFEIPISNEDMMPETQPIGDVLVYVIQRSNDVVVAETLPNHEVVVSEIQQSSEMVMSEIQQSNEVVMPETQPNDEANILETQTFGFDDMVMLKAISENELDNPSTGANNQLSHSEIFADNELVDFDMILEDQQPKPESLPYSKAAPNSEPLIDDHMTGIKPIPQNNLNHLEAFSNDHLANSEGLSQEELSNSQTLTPHYDAQENNEAMHNNKLVSSQEDTKLPVSDAPSKDEITNAETPLTLSDEDYAPETQPSKRRKNRSEVWEHFTMVAVNPGCRRARCNQCSQSFSYSTGSKVVGTSHLKRHIAKGSCSTVARNREPNQSNPDAPNSRRRILNVVMEPFPDSDSTLFHAVAACMGNDWSMLKGGVFSFTYNQLVNGAAFEKLRPLLFVKNTDIVNGQLLLCKCIARTFSSIAKDLLGLAEELIRKIRDNVKYVKTSARNEEKFMNLKQLLQTKVYEL